jgi:tetratricopeptide (TPR) repeat protein
MVSPLDTVGIQLERAAQALQHGAADEAHALASAILAREPENADAFNLLGVALAQRGDDAAAVDALSRAVHLNPNHPGTQINLGNVLRRLGRFDEAVDSFRRAIALRPDATVAYRNLGATLVDQKRFQEAIEPLNRAASLRPDHPGAYLTRARAARGLGNNPAALFDVDNVLRLDPANVDALLVSAAAKRAMGRREEALADCDRAIAIDGENWSAHNNRGVLLDELGRPEEAIESLERSLKLNPENPDTFLNIGTALVGLNRGEEAIRTYDHVLAQHPSDVSALNAKGIVYLAMRSFDDALTNFDLAVQSEPTSSVSHFHRALTLLSAGRLSEGFVEYEWRRKSERYEGPRFRQPELQKGEDPRGKSLLLFAEQGLGDIIQFARFARSFADRGAKVVLAVYPPLTRLLKSLGDDIVVVPPEGPAPDFELTCPLLSTPYVLGTTIDTIPARTPYLSAPAASVESWRAMLRERRGALRVGLAWSGNPQYTNDSNRSLSFAQVAPFLDVLDVAFVSLQKDVRASDEDALARSGVADFRTQFGDLADTAALISALDLVITVDTSIGHLAGALGKPVWIMLSAVPDWRWLHGRNDSPWYPTARLFRQRALGVWDPVFADVKRELAVLASARTSAQ